MTSWKARARKALEEAANRPKRGRPLVTDSVRVYSTGNTGEIARFIMSHDVVERLLQLRDGPSMRLIDPRGLRAKFLRPRELNMPATLMTLEPPTFDPIGQRITQVSRGKMRGGLSTNRYQVHVRSKLMNLRPDFKPFLADTLWLDGTRGVLVIFPDEVVDDIVGLISDRDAIIKEAS